MLNLIINGILIGLGATIVMDIWALVLAQFPGQSRPNWGSSVAGSGIYETARYFTMISQHQNPTPMRLHWAGSVIMRLVFSTASSLRFMAAQRGLRINISPRLDIRYPHRGSGLVLLQPGLGIGWAASRLPNARNVRILNLVAHTFLPSACMVPAFS
ncbi:DUF2938 domain-containing protein [Ochrobactrum grignonense]|nr:DUF2938 domain-containing protein [Brucella grignonensis]